MGAGLDPSELPAATIDWALVAAFAAYSGAGGTINAMLTYWLRDKGFGMAGTVGAQPTPVGDQTILLPRDGAIFPTSEANLAKWREWWRYLRADLSYLWTAGCLIGMGLPVLLALDAVPPGTDMGGFGAGAVFARELTRRYWALLWLPTLLTTLWIFFSTQVGIVEGFARNVTEMLWTAGVRPASAGAGWVYYPVLALFVVAGCLAMTVADPLTLIVIGANIAALNFAVLSFHTLRLNRALLPEPLRPPLWREAVVAVGGARVRGARPPRGGGPARAARHARPLSDTRSPGYVGRDDDAAVHQHELQIGERLDALGRIPRHRDQIRRVARGHAPGHLAQAQAVGRGDGGGPDRLERGHAVLHHQRELGQQRAVEVERGARVGARRDPHARAMRELEARHVRGHDLLGLAHHELGDPRREATRRDGRGRVQGGHQEGPVAPHVGHDLLGEVDAVLDRGDPRSRSPR